MTSIDKNPPDSEPGASIGSSFSKAPIVLARWKPVTGDGFPVELKERVPMLQSSLFLAVPYSMIQTISGEYESAVVGSSFMFDVSPASFTEAIAMRLIRLSGAKFVLLDPDELEEDPRKVLEAVNLRLRALLNEEIPTFAVLRETLEEAFEEDPAPVLEQQLKAALHEVPIEKIHLATLIYSPRWIEKEGIEGLKVNVPKSHELLRGLLEKILGVESAGAVRLMIAHPYKVEDFASVFRNSGYDGVYFPHLALEPCRYPLLHL